MATVINGSDNFDTGKYTPVAGTWSPTFKDEGGSIAVSSATIGHYFKIGTLVYVNCYMQVTGVGNSSTQVSIDGLPFIVADNLPSQTEGGGSIVTSSVIASAETDASCYVRFNGGTTEMDLVEVNNGLNQTALLGTDFNGNETIIFSSTYLTTEV